ncbi:MAG: 6-carboxytetrahydropterin synthase QueD [Elusimicrobiales bacterium]
MFLIKTFSFDAAHNLVEYKGKCERLHGHTYRLAVTVEGKPSKKDGMVMDFAELKDMVRELVLEKLDHAYINDIIPQSTAENMARWIWDRLSPALRRRKVRLARVELWETQDSAAVYEGKD